MSQITTHVLDISLGRPAAGIKITLQKMCDLDGSSIVETIGKGVTNADGRINDLMANNKSLEKGRYRLNFELAEYFAANGSEVFFPIAEVIFALDGDSKHYHIPLLISPFGYSTYRGS